MGNTNDSPVPSPPNVSFPDTMGVFRVFCQKVLPAVYDDSLSYYELLCKSLDYLNKTMDGVNQINDDTKAIYEYVVELYESYDEFVTGGFYDYYEEMLEKWLESNMPCIVGSAVRFFSFGIDDSGHVFVDIPYTWAFLKITWDMDYGSEDFGHIEMEW